MRIYMFQTLPSNDYYRNITRNLLNKGKKAYLSQAQLSEMQITPMYAEGYKTYTGHILTKLEAETLNKFTIELNRETCIATREYLLDARHQMLCIIAENISPKQIRAAEQAQEAKLAEEMKNKKASYC